MANVEANGTRLHYVVDDHTPPWRSDVETLYIQHGAGRTLRFWNHWVPPLSARMRVLRRDLRGHGESQVPPPGHAFSLEELVDDTLAFLDALGLEQVHYLGESISGVTGILAAARAPERFASLTICGAAPTVGGRETNALAGGARDLGELLEREGTAGWVRDVLFPGSIISPGASDAQRDWVVAEYGSTPVHVLQGITGRLSALDLLPVLPTIAVPSLVLAPASSSISPLSGQVAMREAIPDARLAVVESPSHEIYVDRADECIAALVRFLDEIAA
jgi:pimeloyl-ACP methyl ester carboxylesterase